MVELVKSVGFDRAIELYLSGSTVEEARGITTPPISTVAFYEGLKANGIEKRGKVSRQIIADEYDLFVCKCCGVEKEARDFSEHGKTKTGYDLSRCKTCKIEMSRSARYWDKTPIIKRIYDRAKGRAKRKGIAFNLELSDIVLPEVCPVFGKPFIYGDHMWTYSIDKIKPDIGYVKGNIMIISNKANMMKNTANADEVKMLYEWMLTLE